MFVRMSMPMCVPMYLHNAGRTMRLPPRLRAPAQFAAVARASGRGSARAAGHWLTLACARQLRAAVPTSPQVLLPSPPQSLPDSLPDESPALRFGLTVGKRLAARSVDRNLIRRVLREAVRAAAGHGAGDARSPQPVRGVDLVFRLRAAIPDASEMSRLQFKHALRIEADTLLARVLASEVAANRRRGDGRAPSDQRDNADSKDNNRGAPR
jgi:ribonuclease P protein component